MIEVDVRFQDKKTMSLTIARSRTAGDRVCMILAQHNQNGTSTLDARETKVLDMRELEEKLALAITRIFLDATT